MIIPINKFLAVEYERPDDTARSYHTRLMLIDTAAQGMSRGFDRALCDFVPSELLLLALEIPGVIAAHLRPYQLVIQRAPLFLWEEVEPAVLALMAGVVPACKETSIVEERQCLPKSESSDFVEKLDTERA